MSLELPSEPRKIGNHFTFYGLEILEINGEKSASVEYGYKGKYLKPRIQDGGHFMDEKLLDKLLETVSKNHLYNIKKNESLPKDMFKVERKGNIFSVGQTVSVNDRVKVSSIDGASIESFRNFLSFLESSMARYEE